MADIALTVLGLAGLFAGLMSVVLALTWFERKLLARIQQRAGPSVVGPHGLLQPVADAIKLLTKEDLRPAEANRFLFWVAPIAVVIPAFLLWVTIPFADGLAVRAIELGLVYLIGLSVLEVVGLLLAGWGSASKYSMLGGFRAAAQLVSYEIPIIVVMIAVAILVQSVDLRHVVDGHTTTIAGRTISFAGQGGVPLALIMPLGLAIFFIAGLAELGRTPFDIHHAESEVVGGPFVEYSGAHWATFFLAEYMNTFFISALTVLLFFGGWSWPSFETILGDSAPAWIVNALGVAWFLAKIFVVAAVIIWFRGTYPRLRIDQLMSFGWQVLIPLSFANLILAAIVMYYRWPVWSLTLTSIPFLAGIGWFAFKRYADPRKVTTVRMYRRSTRADGEPALIPQERLVPQGVPPLNDRLVSQEPAR
ncbi:MAG: NADH-quinone oxidoreductase subunit NuoH [Chloroflexi bacterium]|nr:NADH-quinone oxidoreductase subunit NuoH [Chloroflexota bacterium]